MSEIRDCCDGVSDNRMRGKTMVDTPAEFYGFARSRPPRVLNVA